MILSKCASGTRKQAINYERSTTAIWSGIRGASTGLIGRPMASKSSPQVTGQRPLLGRADGQIGPTHRSRQRLPVQLRQLFNPMAANWPPSRAAERFALGRCPREISLVVETSPLKSVALNLLRTARISTSQRRKKSTVAIPPAKLLHFKSGGDNWLRSFTLSPLGDMLAYTENKRLLICDAATANVWHQVDSPSVSFRSFTFRSDQKHLAYSLADRSIRIYDLQRRQQVHALNNIPGVMALCYSPDGSLLAGSCISGRIRIWNTKTWTEHVVDKGPYCSIASMSFSPDGKSLATAGSNSSVSLWSTNDGKRVLGPLDPESMQGRYGVNVRSDFVKITPDGKYLLAGGGRRAPEARCWSLPTGKLINRFSGHTYPASGVSTDLAGEFMISIGKPTRLWRLGTNESVRILGADIRTSHPAARWDARPHDQ